jgi:protein SCO1/2
MLLKAMPALLLLVMTSFASAQNVLSGAMVANGETKPAILKDVGIDQKLGAQLPLDQVFNDENGKPLRLDSLLDGRPIILTLVYFRCPMLCTMVLNDLVQSMHQMKEKLGTDFDILTISFDPADTPQVARAKKANYFAAYGHSDGAAQWHFLTGSPSAIAAVTSAVGFRYVWDPDYKQFAHASGIMVLTPQGKISRYFYGVDYEPKDLRLALVEASGGKVGGLADQILLFCCQYDPTTGKYGLAVSRGLKVFGFLTICAVAALVFFAVRRRSSTSPAVLEDHGHAGGEPLAQDATD